MNRLSQEPKMDSYEARRRIAALVGVPAHQDFSTELVVDVAHPQSGDLDVTQATLVSTSNAGFRGIEGHFVTASGRRFVRSLALVLRVEDAGTMRAL